ncbi:hypothetical protein RIF29_28297 [Crotalaria pallida]|uniref:Uncharacterized protein n=1 Tax=Crotalaria pallida TaxID=3830 RepID=A0AAN9I394_CROPI
MHEEPNCLLLSINSKFFKPIFEYQHSMDQNHYYKNAYALSVLRRVEMKIDDGDISENRLDTMDLRFMRLENLKFKLHSRIIQELGIVGCWVGHGEEKVLWPDIIFLVVY